MDVAVYFSDHNFLYFVVLSFCLHCVLYSLVNLRKFLESLEISDQQRLDNNFWYDSGGCFDFPALFSPVCIEFVLRIWISFCWHREKLLCWYFDNLGRNRLAEFVISNFRSRSLAVRVSPSCCHVKALFPLSGLSYLDDFAFFILRSFFSPRNFTLSPFFVGFISQSQTKRPQCLIYAVPLTVSNLQKSRSFAVKYPN